MKMNKLTYNAIVTSHAAQLRDFLIQKVNKYHILKVHVNIAARKRNCSMKSFSYRNIS